MLVLGLQRRRQPLQLLLRGLRVGAVPGISHGSSHVGVQVLGRCSITLRRLYSRQHWLSAKAPKHSTPPSITHMLSDQPNTKLHSQLDHSSYSLANKVAGREPIHIHPDDATRRDVRQGDVVRVFNDRRACLAGAVLDANLRPAVVKLSTGAWWDPESPGERDSLDRHGNPNSMTRDAGASSLSQGCTAQTCLVEVEKFSGTPPPVQVFTPPAFVNA